jgi:hypothetical protein
MTFTKTDGTIEIDGSGCSCCPPGTKRIGQHTNSCSSWWRVNGGEWHKLRTTTLALAIANRAGSNCADFEDAMATISR